MSMSKKSSPRVLKFMEQMSINTQKSYEIAIRKYERFHNLTIEELVCEALDEQTNQVAPHLLKIIDRLEDFQEELIQQGLVHGTIREYMGKIKSIYHKNRIIIPYIEPLNPKRTKRREYIEYKDVLTKDELKQALHHMRLPAQARALTMIQGGLSNEECEHLTLSSFIDDTKCYHKKEDPVESLKWLADENHPIIWITKLIRVKTHKPYYCVIGAEAVNKIAEAKLYEMTLPSYDNSDKLLGMNKNSFGRLCRRINNKLGYGKVADESKLKPHNLRRFHATYIRGSVLTYEENSRITNMEIDELQGRGKTATQDTYIKSNPLEQKLIYAKVMNNLSLWHEYDYLLTSDDVLVKVVDPLKENEILRKKVENLDKQLHDKKKASDKVKMLRQELGNDVFDELIGEILNAS